MNVEKNAKTAPTSPWQATNANSLLVDYATLENIFTAQERCATELETTIKVPLCVTGCGRCCSIQTPIITELEARYIVSSLTTLPTAQRLLALAQCEEWITRRIEGVTIYSSAIEQRTITTEERKKLVPEGNKVLSSACAFFSPDRSCLIHTIRPINCRAWGVTKPVESWCPRPRGVSESISACAYIGDPMAGIVRTAINQLRNTGPCGFLPVMVYRLARPQELQRLVEDGKVADAKLTMGFIRPWLVFEGQEQDAPKIKL